MLLTPTVGVFLVLISSLSPPPAAQPAMATITIHMIGEAGNFGRVSVIPTGNVCDVSGQNGIQQPNGDFITQCTYQVPIGTAVRLTSNVPATSSGFPGAMSNSTGSANCGPYSTCLFTITENSEVTATFSASTPTFTMTIILAGDAPGEVGTDNNHCQNYDPMQNSECTTRYAQGSTVTNGVSPPVGSRFTTFLQGTNNAATCDATVPCSFVLSANTLLTASFSALTTIAVAPLASTVDIGGSQVFTANGGYSDGAIEALAPFHRGTWVTKRSMDHSRYSFGAAAAGNRVYAFGGNSISGPQQSTAVYDPSADSGLGTWTDTAASMPAPLGGFAVGTSDDRFIYAAGGSTAGDCPIDGLLRYDTLSDTWETKAPMPGGPRRFLTGAVVGRTFYAIGGEVSVCGATPGTPVDTVEAYDFDTETWTLKMSMPTARRSLSAGVVNGIIYVVGGDSAGNPSAGATVEAYDPSSNTWSTKAALPAARTQLGVGVIDSVLYAVGGLDAGQYMASLFAYDASTNTWSTKASIPQLTNAFALGGGRAELAVASLDGRLYALGGFGGPGPAAPQDTPIVLAFTDNLIWSTGNAAVASVDQNVQIGWAHGISVGTTDVVARSGTVTCAFGACGALTVVSDTIAPTTTATPSIAANANGWNNSDVTVTLQASDGAGGSGVQSIAYFLPGSNNVVAGNSVEVNITAEGITTLTYQATDGAGNVEAQQALTIRIDRTPPFLPSLPNLSAAATSSAGAVVNFWISPSDGVSGIASTQISPLSSGMTFPPGTTHETVTVFDSAGNSTVGGFDVTVNPTRPFISLIGGTFSADGNPHPATATAVDQANNPIAGTFGISYLPGGSVPVAPGRYSATASFTSNDPAFTNASPWTTMAPDPNAKWSPVVVEINGKLYVHGYDQDAGGNFKVPRLSIYDPWSNTWTLGASPSLVRAYVSAGVINGKMYVTGGCVGADCRIGTTNALEIYDPATNTWSNGPAMPTARFGAASGVLGSKLYVAGGTSACAPCVPITATEIYDPAAGSWTAGAPIPVSRELAAGAAANQRLYVIGGFQRDSGLNAAVGTVHAYDPAANTWSIQSSMPTARYGAAVGFMGTIYVAGGAALGPTAANERYDPASDTWTAQLPMSTARFYVSGGVVGSNFYVIDGSNGAPLSTNEAFDTSLTTTITINPNDTTPPTTNATFPQPNANGWNRFNVNVFLSAFDSGGTASPSGVQSITYTLSGAQTGGGTVNTSNTSFTIVNEGTTTVTYHATDNRGNVEADRTFTVNLDKTSPSAANLSNITVNAASAAGAVVTFDLAPADALSGIATVSFTQGLPSGSTFPHGNTFESVTITDSAGNNVFRSFNVTVNKTLLSIAVTPATATVSLGQSGRQFQAMGHFTDGSDQTLPSQSGGGSSLPTATWQSTNPSVAAINSSGFATGNSLGQTTIIASAGGITCQPTGCATLTVADTTPPSLFVPSQPFAATATSAAGTTVNFGSAVSAFDSVDGNITPSCTPSSGSLFAIGATLVSCQAIDAHQNASPIKTVTVQVSDVLTMQVPSDIVAEATSAAGAVVPFSVSAVYFLGGSEPVQCFIITGFVDGDPQIGPAVSSGATFPLGTTTVGCRATSATGKHTNKFFTITVQDTTPPVVTTSGNVTINATSPAGAVATFSASAMDLVDGVRPVTCAPASGSTFAIGATTVTCSASDASQNTGSATLTVTILSPAQVITNLVSQASVANFQQGGNLLQNALQNVATGNVSTACSQLSAFINQVQAQSGKSLSLVDAASLIQSAMEARAAMGCTET